MRRLGRSRRHLATRGIKEPKISVERMTRARTLATTNSYSEKEPCAFIAKPRAIAPRIIPAYEMKMHSLNLSLWSAPQSTKAYWTKRTEIRRASTIRTNSILIKVTDQSCCGYLKIPKPMYENMRASEK